MMSNQIPGVPEGWEAVSFDYVSDGECWLDKDGDPIQHTSSVRTQCKRLIIRKIEKPAKYRPFISCVEIEPFFNRNLRWKNGTIGLLRISIADNGGIFIGSANYTFQRAFDVLVLDDGTPFGVEIDE
jgi:hypothetical protein